MDYFTLKKTLEKQFEESGIKELADIDWIIVEITGKKRSFLPFIKNFTDDELEEINMAVSKRLKHIPLAYVFGKTNFYGLDFIVSKDVLIPRLDTEVLIETIISDLKGKNATSILDIGTGSGIIAVTLAKLINSKVTAVDISEKALKIAEQNAKANDVRVEFLKSDVFQELNGKKFDVIVSNPPYIESEVINTLDSEVKDHEPILALDGGVSGLDFYREIVKNAREHLNSNGRLYFEIGYNQGESVSQLMQKDYKNIRIIKDYEGNDRVVAGEVK